MCGPCSDIPVDYACMCVRVCLDMSVLPNLFTLFLIVYENLNIVQTINRFDKLF